MLTPAPGVLLVASRNLVDPNFMRSVVYLIEHNSGGSLGLIINRPMDVPLNDLWDDCPNALQGERLCAEGGPVDRHKGLLLHAYTGLSDSFDLGNGLMVGGEPGALADRYERDALRGPRLFLGHAGWGPGQLLSELEEGSWLTRAGHPHLMLNPQPPGDLWADLMLAGEPLPQPGEN